MANGVWLISCNKYFSEALDAVGVLNVFLSLLVLAAYVPLYGYSGIRVCNGLM